MSKIDNVTIEKLQTLTDRRRTWKIVKGGQNKNCHPAIARALQIRNLECAVKEGVEDAFRRGLIDDRLVEVYNTVLDDEKRHKTQLDKLAEHYGIDELDVNHELYQSYLEITKTENPLVVNFGIELIVFINVLRLFQQYGDPYAANIASWILQDEARHIAIGRAINQVFPLNENIIRFALKILLFVIDGLPEKRTIIESAKKSLTRIPSTELTAVVPPTINFFEVKTDTIKY